ncbi:hypothetical protein BUALT_Bualt13G0104100 [Buddleja alternifolia]|uniref:Reverse transcriptase/retrotransposon-derived protein RNase H-like domain-containing protein n=1 Tax=Buddleja alternifolia TaxID=168488 RepID=A0AAV6WM48_9LAMI|nr:hypothetical protein BUALT_Bualt13G0104100 [Buddleja alternifolia]
MDGKKVWVVAEWTAPSKVADLRSFLGLANYYRRFIKVYSKIVNPLTDLLKKDQKWEWTVKCQRAFDLLKQAVSSEPMLKLPEFDKPFEVQTDASDRAIGGVLVQDKHPIAFESRKLKDAEMRSGKHNDVADALSRKVVEEYVAALTLIESDFLERIRESSQNDAVYMKLVEQVGAVHIRKYWLNDGLLYAKGGRAYVPSGPLRR